MTEISWLADNFATLILAGVTGVLVYVTYTLKKATTNLARTQIRPALSIADQQGLVRGADHNTIRLSIKGRGAQGAVITAIAGKHKDGRPLRIDAVTMGQPVLSNGEVFTWDIHEVERDEKIDMTIEYEDIEKHKMPAWNFGLTASWLDAQNL